MPAPPKLSRLRNSNRPDPLLSVADTPLTWPNDRDNNPPSDGSAVGQGVQVMLGIAVGGRAVSVGVGVTVGSAVGSAVGMSVGISVGTAVDVARGIGVAVANGIAVAVAGI